MRIARGFLLVAGDAFRRLLVDKRTLALLLLCALPVLMAYLNVTFNPSPGPDDFCGLLLWTVLQVAVPISALVGGVAVLGDEIEGRTITYLYTRPLPRPVFYLGRAAGHFGATALLLTISVLLVVWEFRGVAALAATDVLGTLGIVALGLLTYTGLFALLRIFFQRALFVGFIITFIFEGMVSKLPVSGFAQVSVWHHLALLQIRLLEGPGRELYVPPSIAADELASDSIEMLLWTLAICVVAGAWFVRSREIRLPAAAA
jgi:ABC-2 type transport system permease protein